MTNTCSAMTLFALVFSALTAQAATPVAIWDRDFNTATSGIYTLDLNGNTANLSDDKSVTNSLTISSTNGILIDSTGDTLNNYTIIVRCSNINLSSSDKQALWTTQSGSYLDGIGVALPANNASPIGINGYNYSNYANSLTLDSGIPSGTTSLAFQYYRSQNDEVSGTRAYAITSSTATNIYKAAKLRFTNNSPASSQLALGGLRGTNTNYKAATGMTITSIAIFNTQLTESDIAAYQFPIEVKEAEEEAKKKAEEEAKKAEEEAKARDEATRQAAVTIPTIAVSDVTTTKIDDATLAIDFTVSGANDYAADYLISVTATKDSTTTKATTLSGATNCVNGAHRVYWDITKDNYTYDASATIAITFKPITYCVIDLSAGATDGATYPVTYYVDEIEGGFNEDEYKTTKLVLKRVEAGLFYMGTVSNLVAITKPYYMGLFEVTQKQWELVTGTNRTYVTTDYFPNAIGDMHPVYELSYAEIRGADKGATYPATTDVDDDSFLGLLRKRSGVNFDLPTEAQWEHAYRGDTTTTYSWGDEVNDDYLWYLNNSTNANAFTINNVGTKKPNQLGLYDMSGSVSEICADYYADPLTTVGIDPAGPASGDVRVKRNGGCSSEADECTAFIRTGLGTVSWSGFRLAGPIATAAAEEKDPVPEIATTATAGDIAAALEGAGDATLVKKVTTCEKYTNYRAWVTKIAGNTFADRKNVKAATNSYLGYALNLSTLPAALPQDGDLTVESLAANTEKSGEWKLALSLKNYDIGSDALSANLKELFTVECTKDLSASSTWTTDLVETTFETPVNGDAIISVKPTDTTATSLFIRLRLSL